MLDKAFWSDTLERIIYTMCETALGVLGGSAMLSEVNWIMVASASALSGIVTLLKCIVVRTSKNE